MLCWDVLPPERDNSIQEEIPYIAAPSNPQEVLSFHTILGPWGRPICKAFQIISTTTPSHTSAQTICRRAFQKKPLLRQHVPALFTPLKYVALLLPDPFLGIAPIRLPSTNSREPRCANQNNRKKWDVQQSVQPGLPYFLIRDLVYKDMAFLRSAKEDRLSYWPLPT